MRVSAVCSKVAVFLTVTLLVAGCKSSEKENIGAAIVYAPLAVPALPLFLLSEAVKPAKEGSHVVFAAPPGLTKAEVTARANKAIGTRWSKKVTVENDVETWLLSGPRGGCRARFKDEISIEPVP